jgi:hypothetical protein
MAMTDDVSNWGDEEELKSKLAMLREDHRDLDSAIAALSETSPSDQLKIRRLKKKKLLLKDKITKIEDNLMPDIIA